MKWTEMEARLLDVYFYVVLTSKSFKCFTHSKQAIPKVENILKGKTLTVFQNLNNYFEWLEYHILAENLWKNRV